MKKGRLSLFLVAFCVLLLAVGSCMAATRTVRLAHRWAVDNAFHLGLVEAVKGFEARYPDIKVQLDYGYNDDKYKVEIAAGTPPDVIFTFPAVSWGADGFVEPLDKYVERAKISAKDFMPAAWYQNIWDGKLWAMPLQVDPNFALIWNNAMLEAAGLDSNKGPVTLDDYDNYIQKLTIRDAAGTPKQVGATPWSVYGNANTVYTWGWVFGGEFMDYEKGRVTAHDPRIVAALEYLRDYYGRLNADVTVLNGGLPTGRNIFTAGREAMRFSVTGELFTMLKGIPDLSIGIGKMPYKVDSGVTNPAWIGGWSISLAKGAKNLEDGWALIEYLTATTEGTGLFAKASGWLPAYIKSPAMRDFATDPYWRVYAEIAMTSVKYRPAIPQQSYYYNELDRILGPVLRGEIMPLDALQEVTHRVETYIAETTKR